MPMDEIFELLTRKIGMNPDSIGKQTIEQCVLRRMSSCDIENMDNYIDFLRVSQVEFQNFVDEVTVPETWFFRDAGSFSALTQMINIKIREGFNGHLKIASLPCSTGEEPYSIAISLLEAGLNAGQFSIDAVDISGYAIRRAREAVYKDLSFRSMSETFKQQYFKAAGLMLSLNEDVKDKVNFYHANVLDFPATIRESKYDILFCRNLLIYLNEHNRCQLVEQLKDMLAENGVIFAGSAESSVFSSLGFKRTGYSKSFSFKLDNETTLKNQIGLCNSGISNSRKTSAGALKQFIKSYQYPVTKNENSLPPRDLKQEKSGIAKENEFAELYAMARSYADTGKLEEAEQVCLDMLEKGNKNADAFYLTSSIKMALGKKKEACDLCRKALYLEPAHKEVLLQYALLLENSGNLNKAQVMRNRLDRINKKKEVREA